MALPNTFVGHTDAVLGNPDAVEQDPAMLAERILPVFKLDSARNHVDRNRINGERLPEKFSADTAGIVPSKVVPPVVARLTLSKPDQGARTLIGESPPNHEVKTAVARTRAPRPVLPPAAFTQSLTEISDQLRETASFRGMVVCTNDEGIRKRVPPLQNSRRTSPQSRSKTSVGSIPARRREVDSMLPRATANRNR